MAAEEVIGKETTGGMVIGRATTSLVSFYGKTPKAQNAHIADATDAATAITTLNAVILALESYGLLAAS